MKCPHCLVAFHEQWVHANLRQDRDGVWAVQHTVCPECNRLIVELLAPTAGGVPFGDAYESVLVYPKGVARAPLPAEVPEPYATDYAEACRVHPDSAKASAALSRRCLQALLRDAARARPSDLNSEIDQVLKSLPSHLAEAIDGIRVLGNFAAHPTKSKNTGEVVDVEPGEAEWLLDVLEGLFDFYYVQPAVLNRKREDLNAKLKDAGKPPLK